MTLSPRFVDAVASMPLPPAPLIAPTPASSERGGIAEFESPRGVKLRIEWRGEAPDLALLSRSIFAGRSESS